MDRKLKILIIFVAGSIVSYFVYRLVITHNPNPNYEVGQIIDSLDHVYVYYNGGVGHTGERNLSEDGYNIGLSYQCVEFVKRYYFQFYKHKMPDSYGNAKDFYAADVKDGKINKQRDLLQFSNPSSSKPKIGDLVVFDGHSGNPYGHVAIISQVLEEEIEIIQQNPGPFAPSRVRFPLVNEGKKFNVGSNRLLGWLRMKN